MTHEKDKIEKIYQAIRKVYGSNGDELVDFLYDLMEDHERVEKGA